MGKAKREADEGGRATKVAKRDPYLSGFHLPQNTPVGGCLDGWEPPRTGLEQQFMQYKVHLADTLIAVECGYKYRFFGRDAEIAGGLLGFFVNKSGTDTYVSCSFPVQRLELHTTRLANNGYRVAHLAQAETAALKADAGKGGLFARVITGLFTRTTSSLQVAGDGDEGGPVSNDVSSNNLMIVAERVLGREERKGTDQVEVSMLSISLGTGGVVVWDSFHDGPLRRELMARLLQFEPVEIVAPDNLSTPTLRCLETLGLNPGVALRAPERPPGVVRYEVLPAKQFRPQEEYVEGFFAGHDALQREVAALPAGVRALLGTLIKQLCLYRQQQFLLTRGTSASGASFIRFSGGGHMRLPSETLTNLEVFTSMGSGKTGAAANSRVRGSLNWVMNDCRTGFGTRRLRQWLSKPLLNVEAIRARHAAVADMAEGPHRDDLAAVRKKVLSGTPDLERIVTKMSYGKAAPREMLTLLKALRALVQSLKSVGVEGFRDALCPLLKRLLGNELWGQLDTLCVDALTRFNVDAAAANNRGELFMIDDEALMPEDVRALKAKLEEHYGTLDSHIEEVRGILQLPALQFKTVATNEYLIDVPNAKEKLVPKSWKKVNAVKASKRYHSPTVLECVQGLQVARDRIKQATDVALARMQEDFTRTHIATIQSFLDSLADLDALFSFAGRAAEPGWCRPTMLDDSASQTLDIKDGRHPVIDRLLKEQEKSYIPNDVQIRSGDNEQIIVVTGPNMGGKSSYLRQVAVAVLLAQAGSYVPGASAHLSVFDGIYVRLGSQDSIMDGQSSFLVEIAETAQILKRATRRSLLVLDELGRGTSTFDGIAIAHAVMDWLVNRLHSPTLFVTHYPELLDLAPVFTNKIKTCHMSFSHDADAPDAPAEDAALNVKFLYKLVSGTSPSSFGMNVAQLAGLPPAVLRTAIERSEALKAQSDAHKINTEQTIQSVFALLALQKELASFIAAGGDDAAVALFKSAVSYIDVSRIVAGGSPAA